MSWFNTNSGLNIGHFFGSLWKRTKAGVTRIVDGIFNSEMTEDKKRFNQKVKSGEWDFEKEFDKIRANTEWSQKFIEHVRQNRHYRGPMIQGHLYYFSYNHPKHEQTLEHWDTSPLALCFGVHYSKEGNLVEYCLNLHYIPMAIRIAVLEDIFMLLHHMYDGDMYSEEPRAINDFSYQALDYLIEKYALDFAVHAYIPSLRKGTYRFDYEEWPKALLIETKGFAGVPESEILERYIRYYESKRAKY